MPGIAAGYPCEGEEWEIHTPEPAIEQPGWWPVEAPSPEPAKEPIEEPIEEPAR